LASSDPRNVSMDTHYSKMARYYDAVYANIVDYKSNEAFLEKIFKKHRDQGTRTILDIACGTGNYTFVFADHGYDVAGIDISDEMLQAAREKAHGRSNPRFLKMDMRKIKLESKYDVATVLFGGFGHLLGQDEVGLFLASLAKHLSPDGLLVFEFWQDSAILPSATGPLGSRSWDRAEDDDRLIVRLNMSKYDAQTNILDIKFDFYILNTQDKRLVDSFSETHLVRTYSMSQIREILERNRFKPLAFYDGNLGKSEKDEPIPASFSTFRILAVATHVE
jgi:SAM-dependent methyltransferase